MTRDHDHASSQRSGRTEASWQERLHRLAETLPVDPQVEAMREAGDPVMTLDALARLEQEHLTRGLLREAGKLPAPPLALRPAPRATRTP